jgi:Transposase IS116/IS110/IS902 family
MRLTAALDAARQPFKSTTWHAALSIALSRADGDLARVTRLGRVRFETAVRRQVARWDAVNPWRKIIDGVFAACADPAGVTELRHGALERVALLLADWRNTQARLADTEQRMVTVLGELGLADLVTSITGLSAVGAASVLAGTGDPRRFTSGRALVKHAGLAPRQKSSGSYTGRTRMTGQGRPALRLAAWRAVWGALKSNPVYAARFAHLTGREHNKLSTGQAHAALAAALLRHLHASSSPASAGIGHRRQRPTGSGPDRRLTPDHRRTPKPAAGASPTRHRDAHHSDLAGHPGQPRPSLDQPRLSAAGRLTLMTERWLHADHPRRSVRGEGCGACSAWPCTGWIGRDRRASAVTCRG